ncbi:MAG: organoarsenical effux MFS transporter ArsJ [Akkermansiaceae bacterium]
MNLRSYSIVTASYWGFTLTDGALRMLVLLHFHSLGYSPVKLAFLFLFYEFFGVITNLIGGWIGSRVGLKFTLFVGLALQIVALVMLALLNPLWSVTLSVCYVMASQALSGIAKDLTKMSSKSALKVLSSDSEGSLFKWVSILTGSKNALKGVGFLLGGFLLTSLGFQNALYSMAGMLALTLATSLVFLKQDMGKSKAKVKFTQLFSKKWEINWLSAARVFLFAARDIWFVVALPVFLKSGLGWSFNQVGSFMAIWVIGYGIVQASAYRYIKSSKACHSVSLWAGILTIASSLLALALQNDFYPTTSILVGLAMFGVIFAINSAIHSYLILKVTSEDQVAINVGFYYMANAWGRLLGTLLSGIIFLWGGITACLWGSALMLLVATIFVLPLKREICCKK